MVVYVGAKSPPVLLAEIVMTGDCQAVRDFFDRAFWDNKKVTLTWDHLEIALENKDKPMMRLLITRGALPPENVKELTLEQCKLLRQCGVRFGAILLSDLKQEEQPEQVLKIGMKMKDGTFYVGISPDTKQPMYAAPSDAQDKDGKRLCLNFNKAAEYAKNLEVGGKKGFRVPSLAELNVVRDALLQNEEMKKTFNLTGSYPYCWYWSSSPSNTNVDYARCQRLSDGTQHFYYRRYGLSVRPVRSLAAPKP
jgi:hypothetical protein